MNTEGIKNITKVDGSGNDPIMTCLFSEARSVLSFQV